MDPDTLLDEILSLKRMLLRQAAINSQSFELAAAIQQLDEWLHKGGYLPRRWQNTNYDANWGREYTLDKK